MQLKTIFKKNQNWQKNQKNLENQKETRAPKEQKGQSLVEYLIIVALVAVGTMGIMRVVGQSVAVKFAKVAESLGAEVSSSIDNAKVNESNYRKKDLRDFMTGAKSHRGADSSNSNVD